MTGTFLEKMRRTDSDGVELLAPEAETVPEDTEHERTVDGLLVGLRGRYAHRDDVQVFGRLAWFPVRENTRVRLDPDVMVVIGRPPGRRSSYRAWDEDGVAPTVIIEVVSRNDTDGDYADRLELARAHGAEEVILVALYAPGGVRVERLRPDPANAARFRTVAISTDASAPVEVPLLGIRIGGGDEVVVTDEHGVWPAPAELVSRLRSETARAEREAARADRLAAQLRAAGIDPVV